MYSYIFLVSIQDFFLHDGGYRNSDGLGASRSAEGMHSTHFDFAVNISCCCAVPVHLLWYTSDSLDHEKA